MISLLMSTLRLGVRWAVWWTRSKTTLWLISMARYGLLSLRSAARG